MNTEKKLEIMQNTYAASVAEIVNTYNKLKVLDYVVNARKQRQPQSAPLINAQLGIKTAEDVFTHMTEVFGCANWTVEKTTDGLIATASLCKLCGFAKKMGGANPCNGWCLDPMKAMAAAIDHKICEDDFIVESTLFDGPCCKVIIKINT